MQLFVSVEKCCTCHHTRFVYMKHVHRLHCRGKKTTLILRLAYHYPIIFRSDNIPANESAAVGGRTANHSERGPLMQRTCNSLLLNTKSKIVRLQQYTVVYGKLSSMYTTEIHCLSCWI